MKHLISTLFLLFAVFIQTTACTTAIIPGKYTADGRPLLYKHRDTGSLQNKLMAFSDGKYDYIGIVNSKDKEGKEVWGGYNSAGFAIMNSASYNLNDKEVGIEEREGIIIKMALQRCATISDFEKMLDSLPKPLFVNANFGAIDAKGGAAYYETGDYNYKKYDANDPSIAPLGYIVRTNYSFSGDRKRDKGVSRYMAAEPLFYQAALSNCLSYRFLLRDVSRHLTHGLTRTNLYDRIPENGEKPVFVAFRDFIPRYSTSSVIVVQGVKENEPVSLTTMWTILGSPLTSVAIPVWLNQSGMYPDIMLADETGNAKLCDWSLQLKDYLFPMKREEGKDYLNIGALINKENNGILQKAKPAEDKIVEKAESLLQKWRQSKISESELKEFCNSTSKSVGDFYKLLLSIYQNNPKY